MDEIVRAADSQRLNDSSAPGRPTDLTVIVAESLVEALAALDNDRVMIRRAKRAVAEIYHLLHERDEHIARSVTEIHRGYEAAETMVTARHQKAVA